MRRLREDCPDRVWADHVGVIAHADSLRREIDVDGGDVRAGTERAFDRLGAHHAGKVGLERLCRRTVAIVVRVRRCHR